MTNPVYDQDAFRGRNDDVAENSPTFNGGGGLNGDWTQDTDVNFRVRFVVQQTNASKTVNNATFAIYQNYNATGWAAVGTSSAENQPAYLVDDTQSIADNAALNQIIGSGTYGTGDTNGYSDGTTDVPTGACDFNGAEEVEMEFCLQLDSTWAADGNTIDLRVELSDGTDLDTYTNQPTITVNVPAGIPSPNISDDATATDSVTVTVSAPQVNVSDDATATDSATAAVVTSPLSVNVQDDATARSKITAGQIHQRQFKGGTTGQVSDDPLDIVLDKPTLAGSVLVACYWASGTVDDTLTIADDQTNTWTTAESVNPNGDNYRWFELRYAANVAANTQTITLSVSPGNNLYCSYAIIEYVNVTTSPFDQSTTDSGTGTAVDSGNITTTAADEVLVGGVAKWSGDESITEGDAWDLVYEQERISDSFTPINVSEQFVWEPLTESFDATLGASYDWWAHIASFKPDTGANASTISLEAGISNQDDATVTDSVTVSISDPDISAQDDATATDSATADLQIDISAADNATAADSTTVSIEAGVAALEINVQDDATARSYLYQFDENAVATDSTTAAVVEPGTKSVDVSDDATATDSVTVTVSDPAVTVQDDATATDSATADVSDPDVNVSDDATATDSATVSIAAAGLLAVNVSDDATATDSATADVSDPDVSVQDDATATDSVTVAIAAVGQIDVNVSDDATATDSAIVIVSDPQVSVQDDATATDSVTVALPEVGVVEVNVSDDATATDTVTLVVSDPNVTVQDDATATDNVTVALPLFVSVQDDATATDTINIALASQISISDGATATDTLTVDPLVIDLVYTDNATATDSISVAIPGYLVTGDPDRTTYVLFRDRRAYVEFKDRRSFVVYKDKRTVV